jgi:hypothetical protein
MPALQTYQIGQAVSQHVVETKPAGFLAARDLIVGATFSGGSGGTSVHVFFQTTIDGSTWWDFAKLAFATAGETKSLTVNTAGPVLAAQSHMLWGLTDNTAINGFLGESIRWGVTIVGTYTGSPSVAAFYQAR